MVSLGDECRVLVMLAEYGRYWGIKTGTAVGYGIKTRIKNGALTDNVSGGNAFQLRIEDGVIAQTDGLQDGGRVENVGRQGPGGEQVEVEEAIVPLGLVPARSVILPS